MAKKLIGFKTFVEMMEAVKRRKIKPLGWGYDSKQKHFVEF